MCNDLEAIRLKGDWYQLSQNIKGLFESVVKEPMKWHIVDRETPVRLPTDIINMQRSKTDH